MKITLYLGERDQRNFTEYLSSLQSNVIKITIKTFRNKNFKRLEQCTIMQTNYILLLLNDSEMEKGQLVKIIVSNDLFLIDFFNIITYIYVQYFVSKGKTPIHKEKIFRFFMQYYLLKR